MTDKPKAEGNAAEPKPITAPNDPPAGSPPPADPPAVAELDAARAEGRTSALAYVDEVNEICALAGAPHRAAAFVKQGTAVADVRKQLLEERAAADASRPIDTQIPAGGGAPEKGALASRMKRLVGKEA